MNILLIAPTQLDQNDNPIKYKKAYIPPLSLAVLSRLTPSRHNVRIINDVVEDIDFDGTYDLIGITAMTSQSIRAYKISQKFREKGIKVIIGGVHPTMLPEEVKEYCDSVVIGEADNLWETILDDAETNSLKTFYKSNFYPDLKRLIIPKWYNMNFKIYPKRIGAKRPMMPIFTTRGCPYNCKFCSVTKYFGKKYRAKPIDNVLKEINETNADNYFFVDDNIACKPEYSRELFKQLKGKNLAWFSQISSRVLQTPDLLDHASKAGCYCLFIGIESINKETLNKNNKGFNKVDEYEELINRMRKAKIIPFLSFIFGFDEDSVDQFRLTLDFLKKNKITNAAFWILVPLPGTGIYDKMKNEGRITNTNWSMYDGINVVFNPKHYSPKKLTEIYWKSYQEMYAFNTNLLAIWQSITQTRQPLISVFFQGFFSRFYFRHKVNSFTHPFAGGMK
jgi:radical SAM superfamily enzyme YgiQ (UPF0313 family)